MRTLPDWRGRVVTLAESAGGVLAFPNALDGLLRGDVPVWPTPEITQKLYASRQRQAFRGNDLEVVVKQLGYYCDLQSLHSEDAITWNFFGPITYAMEGTRLEYCKSLFQLIEPSLPPPSVATICLWRRVPHPDNSSSGGPEIDVLIQTPEVVVVGEAKWLSAVGSGQGVGKNKNQFTLRREYLEGLGRRTYAEGTARVVLSIGLEPAAADFRPDAGSSGVVFRHITWQDLCQISPHPVGDELAAYLAWKKNNSRLK